MRYIAIALALGALSSCNLISQKPCDGADSDPTNPACAAEITNMYRDNDQRWFCVGLVAGEAWSCGPSLSEAQANRFPEETKLKTVTAPLKPIQASFSLTSDNPSPPRESRVASLLSSATADGLSESERAQSTALQINIPNESAPSKKPTQAINTTLVTDSLSGAMTSNAREIKFIPPKTSSEELTSKIPNIDLVDEELEMLKAQSLPEVTATSLNLALGIAVPSMTDKARVATPMMLPSDALQSQQLSPRQLPIEPPNARSTAPVINLANPAPHDAKPINRSWSPKTQQTAAQATPHHYAPIKPHSAITDNGSPIEIAAITHHPVLKPIVTTDPQLRPIVFAPDTSSVEEQQTAAPLSVVPGRPTIESVAVESILNSKSQSELGALLSVPESTSIRHLIAASPKAAQPKSRIGIPSAVLAIHQNPTSEVSRKSAITGLLAHDHSMTDNHNLHHQLSGEPQIKSIAAALMSPTITEALPIVAPFVSASDQASTIASPAAIVLTVVESDPSTGSPRPTPIPSSELEKSTAALVVDQVQGIFIDASTVRRQVGPSSPPINFNAASTKQRPSVDLDVAAGSVDRIVSDIVVPATRPLPAETSLAEIFIADAETREASVSQLASLEVGVTTPAQSPLDAPPRIITAPTQVAATGNPARLTATKAQAPRAPAQAVADLARLDQLTRSDSVIAYDALESPATSGDATYDYFMDLPLDDFAVQLKADKTLRGILSFASSVDLAEPMVLKVQPLKKPLFVLVLDTFDDIQLASDAKQSWMSQFDNGVEPWIRTVGSLQKSMQPIGPMD